MVNGSNVTIYGTSSSSLFDLTDSSGYDGTLSGTASLLASASGNEAFRGVTFAPESAIAVPEPGEMAAVMGACALGVAALIRRRNQREEAASEVA